MNTDDRREADDRAESDSVREQLAETDRLTRQNSDRIDATIRGRGEDGGGTPESLPRLTVNEHLARLERIEERSAARDLPEFDTLTEQRLEDLEIRQSPVAFLRRQDHAGLDSGTARLVRYSLEHHGITSADQLREQGVDDTWSLWDDVHR